MPRHAGGQAIVPAVIISELGMLVIWRNDETPPAGSLSGEIELGESPADAIARERTQEASLLVAADGEIGRRVHPHTGRTVIYVSGRPTGQPEVFLGDAEELAAIRWVDLASVDGGVRALRGYVRAGARRPHQHHRLRRPAPMSDPRSARRRPDLELAPVAATTITPRQARAVGRHVAARFADQPEVARELLDMLGLLGLLGPIRAAP